MKTSDILENMTANQKKDFLKKLSTGKYYLIPIEQLPRKSLRIDQILNAILIPKNSIILTVSDTGEFVDEFGSVHYFEKMIKDELGRFFLDEKAAQKYIECFEKSC